MCRISTTGPSVTAAAPLISSWKRPGGVVCLFRTISDSVQSMKNVLRWFLSLIFYQRGVYRPGLEILGKVHHEGYYVKMAAAWAVSVCYVKFPEKTKSFSAKIFWTTLLTIRRSRKSGSPIGFQRKTKKD